MKCWIGKRENGWIQKNTGKKYKGRGFAEGERGGCRSGSLLDRRMFLDLLVLAAIFRHYFPRCFVIHLQSNQKPSFFPPAVLVLAAFIRASGFIRV
jgi:hypothetical protein